MFVPANYNEAMLLLACSLFCWGSWGNSAKFSKLSFPNFYLIFGCSLFFCSTILGFILGADYYEQDVQHHDFLRNLNNATLSSISYALASGAIFNFSNSLLAVLIGLVGLSVSFPICIGLSLITGTILDYLVQPGHTNFHLLCVGLFLAVLALLSMAAAHKMKNVNTLNQQSEETPLVVGELDSEEIGGTGNNKLIFLCILCGLTMGMFPPLSTASMDNSREGHLIPCTCMFFFTLSAMITTFPIVFYLHHYPLTTTTTITTTGRRLSFCDGFRASSIMDNLWPCFGGFVWSVGTLFNFISGNKVDYSIAYAIGHSAPVVATLWGLIYFKEFRGAPSKSYVLLLLMFVFYGGAVAIIARSSSERM
jgi:glucose uptake protein